jgi:hypothetical protein
MGKTKDVMQIVDPAQRNKHTIESALRSKHLCGERQYRFLCRRNVMAW